MSQERFATVAGVAKNTEINWEKDASSPTAVALLAWAEAGADVLYILTGRRSPDAHLNVPGTEVEADLASIRRNLVEPPPGRAEDNVLTSAANRLSAILRYDNEFITPGVREEVERLLAAATNPADLQLLRAADFAQNRAKRKEMKERLTQWLEGSLFAPSETVTTLLAALALDYGVPVKLLVELMHQIAEDLGLDDEQLANEVAPSATS